MTTANFIQTSLELIAAALIVLGFYFEDRLVKFERKAFVYIKCFFKACLILLKEKSERSSDAAEVIDMRDHYEQTPVFSKDECAEIISLFECDGKNSSKSA